MQIWTCKTKCFVNSEVHDVGRVVEFPGEVPAAYTVGRKYFDVKTVDDAAPEPKKKK